VSLWLPHPYYDASEFIEVLNVGPLLVSPLLTRFSHFSKMQLWQRATHPPISG
jgi:hypothetical protein